MLRYSVHDEHAVLPRDEFVERFVDVPTTLAACRACPNHGRTWVCPEFDFDPMDGWAKQPWVHVFCRTVTYDADQPRTGMTSDELIDEVMTMFKTEQQLAHDFLMELRDQHPGSIPLSGGSCAICPDCTREVGLPCRYPDLMVHPIEAIGGDVVGTMRDLFGITVTWSDGVTLEDKNYFVTALLSAEETPAFVRGGAHAVH